MLSLVEDVNCLDFNCSIESKREIELIKTKGSWELLLYPNPTSQKLNIKSNEVLEKTTKIQLYNSLGQEIKAFKLSEKTTLIELDVSTFIDGIYILKIQKGEEITSKSFIVSKR